VAYRMLGSAGEADDAVRETWLRVSRSGAGGVDNLAGWLTTITARVCLNMLGRARQRKVVTAFLAASQRGDFAALLELLDPGVVLRADQAAVQIGAPGQLHGAHDVAGRFSGQARAARLDLIDGAAELAWIPGGQPRVVFTFTITGGKITAIDMTADPARLRQLDLALLDR
jgi:Sigma-70 region 2